MVWVLFPSQTNMHMITALKQLGSLLQTHGNRIISESVLLSLIADKKGPNLKKKMHIFQRSITTQSHGTWNWSISHLYSALKLASPGAKVVHTQHQSVTLSKCTMTKWLKVYYIGQTNNIYSSLYGSFLCSNQLYKCRMKITYYLCRKGKYLLTAIYQQKIVILWGWIPCSLADKCSSFRETFCYHLQPTLSHSPEDYSLHTSCYENFRSPMIDRYFPSTI